MVLRGKGGRQGVRNALRDLLRARTTTFSGFGNPYHCGFGRYEVTSLGEQRYEVIVRGIGVRVFLREELERFCQYLDEAGALSGSGPASTSLLDAYMEAYMRGVSNKAANYRRKIGRIRDAE